MIPLRQFRLGYAAIEMFHQILAHLLHTLGLFFVQIGRSCRHGFRFIHFLAALIFFHLHFGKERTKMFPVIPVRKRCNQRQRRIDRSSALTGNGYSGIAARVASSKRR